MNDITVLSGVLIVEDGKLLLLHKTGEDHYEVPGGKVNPGEAPTEAAIRETQEEINVEIELQRPYYSGEFQHNDELYEWHGYIASINDGRPEIHEVEKFDELKWFSREEFTKCEKLAPNLRMIEHGLKRLLN